MKNMLAPPRSGALVWQPALIGFFIVLPLMMLELVNRRTFSQNFPIPVFGFLWLLSAIFMAILMPIVRTARAGNHVMANPVSLFLKVVCLVVIAGA